MSGQNPARKPAGVAGGTKDYQVVVQLMREMESPSHDPIPPSQYLTWQAPGEDAEIRYWAWLMAGTIQYGRRSAYVIDEHGNYLRIQNAANDLGIDLANLRKIHARFEKQGRVRTESGRLHVLGRVQTLEVKGEEKPNKGLYKPFPPYILKQLKRLSPERRAEFDASWSRESQIETKALRETVAAVRVICEQRKDNTLAEFGVKKRREEKTEKKGRVDQPAFLPDLEPAMKRFVQTFSGSVHTSKKGLYNVDEKAKRLSVQSPHPYCVSEQRKDSEASSSDSAQVAAATTTTTSQHAFFDALLIAFRRAGKPAPTLKQANGILPLLDGQALAFAAWLTPTKLKPIEHPGALPVLAREFVTSTEVDAKLAAADDLLDASNDGTSARRDRAFAAEVLKSPDADEEQKAWAREVLAGGAL